MEASRTGGRYAWARAGSYCCNLRRAALAYLALFTRMPDSARRALLGGAAVLPFSWAALTARRGAHLPALTSQGNAPTAITLA